MRIAEVQAMLKDLLEEHRQIRTEINESHNPLILQVPPEITSSIFAFSMPLTQTFAKKSFWDKKWKIPYAAPLVLGSVCRGWRDRAWATPDIWAYVLARLSESSEWQVSLVRDWLARSGSLPISVYAYDTYDKEFRFKLSPVDDKMIDLLNQHSSRWETLCLNVSGKVISKFTGTCTSSDTTLLRNLMLLASDTAGEFVMKSVTPKPIKVFLEDCLLKTVSIEWGNVTEVEIFSIQIEECLDLLKSAGQLKKAKFAGVRTAPITLSPSPMSTAVYHPTLQDLDIEFTEAIATTTFFDLVTFTALAKLKIGLSADTLIVNEVAAFILRSSCRLKELILTQFRCEYENLLPLLSAIPSLEHLYLCPGFAGYFDQERFLCDLAHSAIAESPLDDTERLTGRNRPLLLPHLHTLTIDTNHYIKDWTSVWHAYGPLDEVSSPRRRPLRLLRLHFSIFRLSDTEEVFPEVFLPNVEEIVNAGLEVQITFGNDGQDLIAGAVQRQREAQFQVASGL